MGNLTIRNLDDRVIEQLKVQARANQRSQGGRFVLTETADRGRRERTRRLAAMTADVPQTDSV